MQAPSFDSVKRLAFKLALRVQRRLRAFGAQHLELDDIMQEAYIAYDMAARCWDASRNVPFATFFARGMIQHLNRVVQREERHEAFTGPSLDACFTEEEDGALHEVIPGPQDDPEHELLLKERGERVLGRLSADARKMMELLNSPPPFLFQQLQAIQDRAQHARTFCRSSVVASEITLGLIADFMGLTRSERRRLYDEIHRLAERVSK